MQTDTSTTTASSSHPTAGDVQESSSRSKRAKDSRRGAPPEVILSKALSWLLRHGALKEKLAIRPDGFVKVEDVLKSSRIKSIQLPPDGRKVSLDDVKEVVQSNEKKRFELREEEGGYWIRAEVVRGNEKKRFELREEEGGYWIRAVQGHSLENVDVEMTRLTLDNLAILAAPHASPLESSNGPAADAQLPGDENSGAPVYVLHGTNKAAWELIKSSGGLSRMKRQHIHLAAGRPGSGVISGMRTSSPLILHVDLTSALADGIPFLVASNGAVLTPGIDHQGQHGVLPLKYVAWVEQTKDGKQLWEREEEWKSGRVAS
ncbi:RNA:NAD 2'-phosphotransferase TPT1 [Ceraceosorus bombacis]|uniref:2'-phosphotransferase n=1 Tax=Ceraceosorus bombacis TaxID=401625 RepID=A0A0P1BSJ4_9BASI|nr:RNA:NAD 2'-phosphotransferase TPT1 [Ceraceosorus bombacis]